MSTATAVLNNAGTARTPGHTATIYLKEAKYTANYDQDSQHQSAKPN